MMWWVRHILRSSIVDAFWCTSAHRLLYWQPQQHQLLASNFPFSTRKTNEKRRNDSRRCVCVCLACMRVCVCVCVWIVIDRAWLNFDGIKTFELENHVGWTDEWTESAATATDQSTHIIMDDRYCNEKCILLGRVIRATTNWFRIGAAMGVWMCVAFTLVTDCRIMAHTEESCNGRWSIERAGMGRHTTFTLNISHCLLGFFSLSVCDSTV